MHRLQRKVRLGMVGGGPGSTIGATHRNATRFDERYTLVTGVFVSAAERSRVSAATLDIADRRYGRWQEMATAEAKRTDGIDTVTIVTPNNSHDEIANAFLEQGIDLICDKPQTTDLHHARDRRHLTGQSGGARSSRTANGAWYRWNISPLHPVTLS